MVDRVKLVRDLRDRLKDGATPSRLIRDIIAQLGDTTSPREVQEVLAEAFQLPIVRLGPSLDLIRKGYKRGILNRTLLAEIIENKQLWEAFVFSPPGITFWLDGLNVASPEDVRRNLTADSYPGLSKESWATLSHDEQQTLLVQLASGRVLSDRLEILSRLVERLQEKVDESEGRRPVKPDFFQVRMARRPKRSFSAGKLRTRLVSTSTRSPYLKECFIRSDALMLAGPETGMPTLET